jgi:carbonic anhydrase
MQAQAKKCGIMQSGFGHHQNKYAMMQDRALRANCFGVYKIYPGEVSLKHSLKKILHGYQQFRQKYAHGDQSIMQSLSDHGQQPQIMIVACCDSRVDPALILQCEPGDLFVVRNVANIVPPFEKDDAHHGTSAALEFGICYLKVKHLILLGHSQCGGIQSLLTNANNQPNDFINHWVALIKNGESNHLHANDYAKLALKQSRQHCLTFPWLKEKIAAQQLQIHLWYFDIKTGLIYRHNQTNDDYELLDVNHYQD